MTVSTKDSSHWKKNILSLFNLRELKRHSILIKILGVTNIIITFESNIIQDLKQ